MSCLPNHRTAQQVPPGLVWKSHFLPLPSFTLPYFRHFQERKTLSCKGFRRPSAANFYFLLAHVWELALWFVSAGGEVLAPDASHENAPWPLQIYPAIVGLRGLCTCGFRGGPGQARMLARAVF